MGFMVQQVGSIPAISHNIKIGKNMLKEEFEKLIKREVNENQYKNIETAYEALPEYMDKMYLASAISNDIGKAINVLSFLGSHISELMGSIIIERQKVESCAYDLINKSHEEDDLKAREIAVRLIGERETVAYTVKEGLPKRIRIVFLLIYFIHQIKFWVLACRFVRIGMPISAS